MTQEEQLVVICMETQLSTCIDELEEFVNENETVGEKFPQLEALLDNYYVARGAMELVQRTFENKRG